MRSASYLSPTQKPRRALSLALTLIAHALLLLLFLKLTPPPSSSPAGKSGLITFDVAPEAQPTKRPPTPAKKKRAQQDPRPRPQTPPPPVIPFTPLIPGLEKFDLRNVRSSVTPEEIASAASRSGQAQGSASTSGPGEGPGGVQLFNAEWYREPTGAELSYYLPARRQTGWGMIACRTVERYRVEDCRELGSHPPGSGLARAVRQAAWQFRVRPPRIDGKPMIGSWVRIRIEFTEAGEVVGTSNGR